MKIIKNGKIYKLPLKSNKIFFDKLRKKGKRYVRILVRGKYYNMLSEKGRLTRYKRGPEKGRLVGRYTNVPTYYSDNLRYLRLKQNMDLDKDGIPDLYKGQIISRVKKEINNKPKKVMIDFKLNNLSSYKKEKKY